VTTRRIRLTLAGLLATWIGLARWVGPAVIRWVHGGGGPGFVRRMMAGRSNVSLESYLDRWGHLALRATFVLVTILIVAWFVLPLFGRLRSTDATTGPGKADPSPLALATTLMISVWCGLVFGLGESHYLAWKTFVLHEVVPKFRYVSAESVWMAPLVDVTALVIVAALAWAVGRMIRRPLTLRWLVSLAAFVALASLVLVTGRLTMIATLLLSLGLAVRLGAIAAANADGFQSSVRRTLPWLAATLAAVAVLVTITPMVAERLAIGRLPAAPTGVPNVLVIVLDTERASSMGLYGYRRPTTPNLNRIARRGVLFDKAMAPSSWTLPSHASMFTSRYPGELSTTFLNPLDNTYATMAEVLRDRGYMTAGFVANLVFCTPLFGLNRGFAHYEAQPIDPQMTLESAWLGRSLFRLLKEGGERTAVRKDAAQVTRSFLAWQAAQSGRPYLAFLNYFDAHGPYVSPPPYRSLYAGDSANSSRPAATQELLNSYDGAITYLDAQLDSLFAELQKRGQLEHTVVILTADHGEEFGEHGYFGHGVGIEFPILHVPLLVMYPSLPAGTRIAQPVTLTDLPATVMEFTGVSRHPFHGRSWSRFWNPGTAQDSARGPVYSEYGTHRSILLDGWHFTTGPREALYNIATDPGEQSDLLAAADPALLAELRAAMTRMARQVAAPRQE